MENYDEIINLLHSKLKRLEFSEGFSVGIIGESGIGKTYLANTFISQCSDNILVISFKGSQTGKQPYSSIYRGLYNAIPKSKLAQKGFVLLLKKFSRLLPGFGKYIATLIDYSNYEVMAEFIKRSGLSIGQSPTPHIIEFIKNLASKKNVLLYCDDSQWVDQESWEFIENILPNLRNLGWALLLLYNDRVETLDNGRYLSVIKRWEQQAERINWTTIKPKRWKINNLSSLCNHLLGGRCNFNETQLRNLHYYSGGIPLYVKSIIDVLKERKHLEKFGDVFVGKGDWENLDIKEELLDVIEYKLKKVYREIPDSRKYLEVASILGETFGDATVDGLLECCNSFQLFSEVEKNHRIIEYLLETRDWIFEHNQIREIIYKSLGKKLTKELHNKVATYLESNELSDSITLAFHYEQAENYKNSVKHKFYEVNRLLGEALFNSALAIAEQIQDQILQHRNVFTESEECESKILRGRCLYHLVKFKDALNEFLESNRKATTNSLKAVSHRWLGRCYTKLDTPADFKKGCNHLKIAIKHYKRIKDVKSLGEAYTDLIVGYAHLNQFKEARKAFAEAEKIFTNLNDVIGMARLQRRNVIFMEPQLSAPILEKVANTFAEVGIPHERIMALNNAATEYLYLEEFNKAQKLLDLALKESININDFGQDYIYNNFFIIYLLKTDYHKARQCIEQARCGKYREVVQLVIDINETILVAHTDGHKAAIPLMERVLDKSLKTGENAYIFPAKINLAHSLIEIKDYSQALKILNSMKPQLKVDGHYSHPNYKNHKWYKLIEKCLKALRQEEKLDILRSRYKGCLIKDINIFYSIDYSLIDMQFWSD